MKIRLPVATFVMAMLVTLTPTEARASLRHATWVRRSPAPLEAVAATPHGGSVATGSIPMPHNELALYVARYSAEGRELWHRRWLPPRRSSGHVQVFTTSVAFGPELRVVTAGSLVSLKRPCPGWYVRVYSPSGDLRWSRTMPGWRSACRDNVDATGVAVTDDAIVVAANHTGCCADPYDDAFLMEFSLRGRLRRTIDIEPSRPAWNERVFDVTVGVSGTIFVTGSAELGAWTVDAGGYVVPPNADPFVMALTPSGSVRWKVLLRDGAGAQLKDGLSIDVDAGVLAVAADVPSANQMVRAYRLVRFSPTGTRAWQRTIRTREHDSFWAEVAVAPTGRISLLADHAGRPLLRTFRANGTVAWSARVGSGLPPSPYWTHDVDATSAGVFVAGTLLSDGAPIGGRIYRYRA